MEKYYVIDEEGNKIDFINDIVSTFKTDDGTKYVVFTDYRKNDKGETIIYGATVDEENILTPIPEEELYLLDDIIKIIKEKNGEN